MCFTTVLQPLSSFQLYIVFNQLRCEASSEVFWKTFELFPDKARNWQLISVLVSILALAISFTVNYRENKENSMGFVSTLVYFVYIIMAVVARTLCFEMFAFHMVSELHNPFFLVKTPEVTWHVEFVKLKAVFSIVSEQFLGE